MLDPEARNLSDFSNVDQADQQFNGFLQSKLIITDHYILSIPKVPSGQFTVLSL